MRKTNKVIKILGTIVCVLLLIFMITANTYDVNADLGNYNRYPSGGSDFDYSSDSGDGFDLFFLLYMIFDIFGFVPGMIIIFVLAAVGYYMKKNGKSINKPPRNMHRQPSAQTQYQQNVEQLVKQTDPNFSEETFLAWSKDAFVKLQTAWSNGDLKPARYFESNELFSQHSALLEEYIRKGQRNIVERINVKSARLLRFRQTETNELITAELSVVMRDYVIEEKTNKVVEGIQNRDYHLRYELTFLRTKGVKSKELNDGLVTTNCPNCGAPTEITSSGQCKYCDSVITTGEYSWVLSNIRKV